MAQEIDGALNDWMKRLEEKTKLIEGSLDNALLKATIFCEGKAKQNAMERIYNMPIPLSAAGKERYKRTGLYKASIGSGMDPDKKHSAIIFNTAAYAKHLEFGTSRGIAPRYIMSDAVFKNREEIRKIIKTYLEKAIKGGS